MRWLLILVFWPGFAGAETLVATRLIRATDVVQPQDVRLAHPPREGAARDATQVVGLEARVAIYPGQPVRLADLRPAAVIERNEIVRMIYRQNGLMILTDGRVLGRGALGDIVSVMNLSSRQSVQGIVKASGLVEVTGSAGLQR